MTGKKNVPNLRFKEFSDEWEEKRLGEVCEIVSGGTPSTETEEYWNGTIDWFTPSEIGDSKYVDCSKRKISSAGLKNSSAKRLPVGSILLTSRATLGEMAILKNEATTNQGFQSIIPKEFTLTDFIYYNQANIKKYCLIKACGSTFLEINKKSIEKLKLFIPSLPEQQKIGAFLSSLDNLIEKQEEKVRLLEDEKKALMQKIFSQTIRFKDDEGNEFPKWKEKRLCECLKSKQKGTIPIYSHLGNKLLNAETLENKLSNIYVLNKNDVKKDDLLILWDGFKAGKIYTNVDGVLGSTFVKLELNEISYHLYIYHYLMHNGLKIERLWVEGTTIQHISKSFIQGFKVKLPSLQEQQKIAQFLSSFDQLIEKEKEILSNQKVLKQGLLQQMFV